MPDVLEFHPERASPEEWRRLHVYRRRYQQERRPDEPLTPDDVMEGILKRPDPREFHHRYHVVAGGEMVAELYCSAQRPESPEYATNKHLLWAFGYVLEAHRRQGIGRGLVPIVLSRMDEHDSTVASSVAEDEPGHAFLRGLGAESKMVERASRLDLSGVDWDEMDRWVREGEERSPGARLDLYPRWVPDELLDEHCTAMTELLNLMPFEDLDHGDIVITGDTVREWRVRMTATGTINPTCVVRDADGSMFGMTDVLKHPHEPGVVRQLFTGVHPRARGRGLGKWLKAAMLRHVREAHPDTRWISTENAGTNDAMLAINHAMGFRLHRVETFYQVSRETLGRASP
ncbi:MAG TPA: GNAT family N-acetyltransferase [Candidatus Dormibacteraeota bacterium]